MVTSTRTVPSVVMRGLDPRIHDDAPLSTSVLLSLWPSQMDCRVKPGNDGGEVVRASRSRGVGAA
jgi:hypothetical protein